MMTSSAPRPAVRVLEEHVVALLSTADEKFLGSAFPINREMRLYLAARHTIPNDDRGLSLMVRVAGRFQTTPVEQMEVLPGQPDVVILRAADGIPPLVGLAESGAFLWEDVYAAGFADLDIRQLESGTQSLNLRGLKGSVTRAVEADDTLKIRGPAYEVSFAIPKGMSGGPVYLFEPFPRYGLVGVCLGNIRSSTGLWYEEPDEGETVTYGVVAVLHRSLGETISMAGTTLGGLFMSE